MKTNICRPLRKHPFLVGYVNFQRKKVPFLNKFFMFSFVIIFIVGLAPAAFGATYYVSTTGDDSNPGTEAQPWRTIQKATNTVRAGDAVIVKAGTYNERVIFPSGTTGNESNKIVFKADPRRSVTMNGFRTTSVNYLRIEGFNITYNQGGWLGGGIWLTSSNVEIVDNYFYDIPGVAILPTWQSGVQKNNIYVANNKIYRCNKGIVIGGQGWLVENNEIERLVYSNEDADYMRFFGENHIIRNNYFHGTLAKEIGPSHIDGFQTFEDSGGYARNIIIENNIVRDFFHEGMMMTGARGSHENIVVRNNIFSSSGSAAWGICAMGINNLKVYNNLFADIATHGVGFRRGAGNTPTTGAVKNNIFYNGGSNYWKEEGCTLDGAYNLLYKTSGSINPANYPNDIVNKDPKFVDVANKNYRLQAGSPGIDAGVTLSGFSTDKDGRSRPKGSPWDIGAYEYGITAPRNLRVVTP